MVWKTEGRKMPHKIPEFSAKLEENGWRISHSGLSEGDGILYYARGFDTAAIDEGREPRGPYLIFDGNRLLTDLYGQIPLFRGKSSVSTEISTETLQHNPLISIEFGDGMNLLRRDADHLDALKISPKKVSPDEIADRFREAVLLRAEDSDRIGLLLSGGVDSSAIAAVLTASGYDFTAFCVSTDDIAYGKEERKDITAARALSKKLGFDLVEVVLDIDRTEEAIPEIYRITGMKEYMNSTPVYLPVITALSITYYFALESARRCGCTDVFSGIGSEEIFGGFVDRTGEDLNAQVMKRTATIYHRDLWRDYSLASHSSILLSYPFLDNELVKMALSVDAKQKVRNGEKKYIWRKAAERLGVPEENAWRKNKATQYGSGADRVLEHIVRRSGKRYRIAYLEGVLNSMPQEKI